MLKRQPGEFYLVAAASSRLELSLILWRNSQFHRADIFTFRDRFIEADSTFWGTFIAEYDRDDTFS